MQNISLSKPRQNKFGEPYFQEINGLTFERLSSDVIFNNYFSDVIDSEDCLYVVIGTDSGLFYKFIKEREDQLKPNVKFIFIDFDEVNEASGLLGGSDEIWDGNIRLVNQDFNFERIHSEEFQSYVIRRNITLIKSLAVMDAKPGTPYFNFAETCEIKFTGFRRSAYNALSTRIFEEERIINAADNIKPAQEITGVLRERDVLILGGGPTLDDSIDWIRENQNRLIIFAAARIANRLTKESIIPDFFITVDPFAWSFDNSKGILAFSNDSVLLYSFHAQHKIVSQWNGLSAYLGERYGWSNSDSPNVDAPGPTVTNTALHLACVLGGSRVFLSGIDFCFAKGMSHESGSEEAKMSDTYAYQNKAKLEDYEGNMTESSDDFYSAFFSMQHAVQAYKAVYKTEIYSLGLHSAKMEGVPYISCNDVVLNGDDKSDLMLSIKETLFISTDERRKFANKTVSELKEQLKRFRDLQKVSEQGLEDSGKLFDKKTLELNTKAMTKVLKLRKKAEGLVADDGDMIMNYQATFFSDAFKPVEDEEGMEKDEIVEQLTSFFRGLQVASKSFIEILKQGVDRAQLRADELNPKVMPSELFKSWEKIDEFGRAKQWDDWQDLTLSESEQAILDVALANFREEFEKVDHVYSSMIKKNVSNVAALLARASKAYDDGNIKELEGLISHSEEMDAADESAKQSFIHYLKGMHSELQGDTDSAIDFYLQIEMPFFRQKGFKKLLNMFMSQNLYQESLVVLEQLCSFSLDYMIPYADLLALLDNKEAATQVLELYLTNHSENLQVQNKYAQLLIELGELDKAAIVLKGVLEQDPINKTALFMQSQLVQ